MLEVVRESKKQQWGRDVTNEIDIIQPENGWQCHNILSSWSDLQIGLENKIFYPCVNYFYYRKRLCKQAGPLFTCVEARRLSRSLFICLHSGMWCVFFSMHASLSCKVCLWKMIILCAWWEVDFLSEHVFLLRYEVSCICVLQTGMDLLTVPGRRGERVIQPVVLNASYIP